MSLLKLQPSVSAASVCCDYCGLPTDAVAQDEPNYCCFGCRFAAGISGTDQTDSALAGPATSLGLSAFFTMNVIMMTMALWSYAAQPESPFETALGHFLRYGGMLFSMSVLLLLGRPLVSHALSGLRRGFLNTDLLLTVGVLAAFLVSVFHTLRGFGHVYFEVGCVILVLVTLGRWLEAAGRAQASSAIDDLERLVPDEVRLWIDGKDVPGERKNVVPGDKLHLLAGDRVPADSIVEVGRGIVDEQFFTGESIPVEKQTGDPLLGGTLNMDGDLIVRVTSSPSGGALGRLVQAVKTARLTKGRYQLLSDQWSQWFFPGIGLIAMGAFLFHGWRVDWEYGLLTALSVLLIACPCALALATPLAIWVALGTAAKRSVLFRNGAALEGLATIRAIRWDKTGTLTTGMPRVKHFHCEYPLRRDEVAQLALQLASSSRHLFSQAVHDFLVDLDPKTDLREIRTIAGRGLEGASLKRGTVRLGSVRWLQQSGLKLGPELTRVLESPSVANDSVTAIGFNGVVQGLFVLVETVRPEAEQALEEMQRTGINQAILTGDRSSRITALSRIFGLPIESELMPEEKLQAIRKAHDRFGCVAMVGDGLNDAPALAAADVGIALGCGADVSRDSADICLLSNDLRLVPWTLGLSRRTVSTIRSNLAWSFGYNGIGVIFAACGRLHPAMAAVLMVVSSLMVLGNSLRLSSSGSPIEEILGKDLRNPEKSLRTERTGSSVGAAL